LIWGFPLLRGAPWWVRAEEADTVLVELGLVEQRYRAVLEVLDDGATVVEVARRYGVAHPDPAWVVAALCRGGSGWAGRPEL
jgi:hypothetical protein